MKWLVDESVEVYLAEVLRERGDDVRLVGEVCPGVSDADGLAGACADDRIVLTNDLDFGDLVMRKRVAAVGVVLLRISDEHPVARIERLVAVLGEIDRRMPGVFAVVTDTQVRWRLLPPLR